MPVEVPSLDYMRRVEADLIEARNDIRELIATRRPSKTPLSRRSLFKVGVIVCRGPVTAAYPTGQAAPTNENYWVQIASLTEADPDIITEVIEPNTTDGDIVLATNVAEMNTHTHSLRVGTVVLLYPKGDEASNRHLLFSKTPLLFLAILGGLFTAVGCRGVDNHGVLNSDHWLNPGEGDVPAKVVAPGIGDVMIGALEDIAYFGGTYWVCGIITAVTGFDINGDPEGDTHGLAYWSKTGGQWVVVTGTDNLPGTVGKSMLVWDRPNVGNRLFVSVQGAGAETNVFQVDFDEGTETVTKSDISWIATIGENATVNDMLPWDDGSGERLWFIGNFLDTGSTYNYPNIVGWDGSSYVDIDGPDDPINGELHSIAVHDFQDGVGERLIVGGRFTTIASTTMTNVSAYRPNTGWEAIGDGLSITGAGFIDALASFNGRLWASNNGANSGTLLLWKNGAAASWLPATNFVKGIYGSTPLYTYTWTGYSNSKTAASVSDMRVYQNKLYLGGAFSFRDGLRPTTITGPFVQFDEPNDVWARNLPAIRDKVNTLTAYNGKVFVGGEYTKGLPGGRISNAALWDDSGTVGVAGVWDNLLGGVDGEVTASCIYNGDLYVGGNFATAGSVAVKGLARWTGTTWEYVANFSDYGTILSMVEVGDRLYIAGDFDRADGQAQYGYLCRWNGESLESVIASIAASDGAPVVRAVYGYGGMVYAGGSFDTIDGLSASNVAEYDPSGDTWATMDDTGAGNEGIHNGTVWSLSHWKLNGSGSVHIVAGCTQGTIAGSDYPSPPGIANSNIWGWDIAAPDWTPIMSSQTTIAWGPSPVVALEISADSTTLWAGISGNASVGEPPGTNPDRVVKLIAGPTYLAGTNGFFEGPVSALLFTGGTLYAGGDLTTIGTLPSSFERGAQGIVAIDAKDRIVDVAGGIGYAAYFGQFIQAQGAERLRILDIPGETCPRLGVAGSINIANDEYAQYVAGVTVDGRIRKLGGMVSGSRRGSLPGAGDGVRVSIAVQTADHPAWWSDVIGACDADNGFVWLIGGSFSAASNELVDDEHIGAVDEEIDAQGIVLYSNGYMYKIVGTGYGDYLKAMAVYDGGLIAGGGLTAPQLYTGDETSGTWADLIDEFTVGGLTQAAIQWFEPFDDDLYVFGVFNEREGGGPSTERYVVAVWNGTAYTFATPTGFADDGTSNMVHATVATIGATEKLYACGTPDTNQCPVVSIAAGGAWGAVGGASQLRGECYALSAVPNQDATGAVLIAVGALSVDEGSGFNDCDIAVWDGTSWAAAGFLEARGVAVDTAAGTDGHGLSIVCENGRVRAMIGMSSVEVADSVGELGTSSAKPSFGVAEYTRDGGMNTFQGIGGANGPVLSIGSASKIVFPPTA